MKFAGLGFVLAGLVFVGENCILDIRGYKPLPQTANPSHRLQAICSTAR
jgi:hypothetical protein